MADKKCSVSWCNGTGRYYYRGDRVTKAGQNRHKRGAPCYAQDFYKSYFWVCENHSNGNFGSYRDDKNWDKWQEQTSIAIDIYRKNWGDY